MKDPEVTEKPATPSASTPASGSERKGGNTCPKCGRWFGWTKHFYHHVATCTWHRVSIRYDGNEIIGMTARKRPENREQLIELIRELLRAMESPTIPDPEVLGDNSPNTELTGAAEDK